jgi:hypothetical protein
VRHAMLRQFRPVCRNENMPVHASPPDVWDVSLFPDMWALVPDSVLR